MDRWIERRGSEVEKERWREIERIWGRMGIYQLFPHLKRSDAECNYTQVIHLGSEGNSRESEGHDGDRPWIRRFLACNNGWLACVNGLLVLPLF
jgi:hypothetical protein